MQNDNMSVEHHNCADRISELMYKLDMSSSKVEQSAFDSINMTDKVMNGLQKLLELVQTIMEQQMQVCNAMESGSLTLEEKNLTHLANEEATNLSTLELELHKIVAIAMEANDAARCIEAGVAEQSDNIADLIQMNEELLREMDLH